MDIRKMIIRGCGLRPLLLVVVLLTMAVTHADDNATARAHQMKAATIYKFARYIQWPESVKRPTADEALSICLLGEDLYDGALHALQNSTNITVRPVDSSSQAIGCEILVIGKSEEARLDQVLQELDGKSVVTVSEIERFTDQGGMIRLYDKNNRIRFDINLRAAQEAELRFDLRLIRLSVAVSD